MKKSLSTQFYVSKEEYMVSPVTGLDNVFISKSYEEDVQFISYSFFDGKIIGTEISKQELHHEKKLYTTTDH
jgi:hypothetical protein